MELFMTWKFLHISAMLFGLALAISGEVVLRRVAASGDIRAIRQTVRAVKPLSGTVATVLILAGVAFGVLAALAGQINLLAPWLITAYILFALAMVIGIAISDPWVGRVERMTASSGDEPSAELREVLEDRRARAATIALMILATALVFVMVVKPFS